MNKLILALVFWGAGASAENFGLGIILGAPTGASGLVRLSKARAIDAAMAWNLGEGHFHLHGDYLWQKPGALRLDNVNLDFFFGIGARLVIFDHPKSRRTNDDVLLGVRGPVGLSYTFRDPRIEVFGEIALIMNLIESTSVDVDGGIGARYYF